MNLRSKIRIKLVDLLNNLIITRRRKNNRNEYVKVRHSLATLCGMEFATNPHLQHPRRFKVSQDGPESGNDHGKIM
jgi:hypothetical protein